MDRPPPILRDAGRELGILVGGVGQSLPLCPNVVPWVVLLLLLLLEEVVLLLFFGLLVLLLLLVERR